MKDLAHVRRTAVPGLLLVAALAGCRGTPSAVRGPALDEGPVPEARRLREDVLWLADDARAGRRAGTPGERAAAEWIAARMGALGLEPAGEGGFLQPVEVPLPVEDRGASCVTAGAAHFATSADVVPLFCSEGGEVRGPLVFAGYGIVRPEQEWDDYAGADLTGAVVLLVRGTPPAREAAVPAAAPAEGTEENPHGDLALRSDSPGWGGTGSIFHKVMEAKRRGAAAVLVAPHPDAAGEPLLAFDAGRSARASIPALMVGARAAEVLVPGYVERVARLDADGPAEAGPARIPAEDSVLVFADVARERGVAHNVLGLLRGSRSERVVVVGAHFDHLGHGDVGSLAPDSIGEIHNGADDNASGTAVVLEVARCLAAGAAPPCDVLFALWSGEELGLLGSERWVAAPTVPAERIACKVNLDMVGRGESGALQVLGAGSAAPFPAWVAEAGADVSLELVVQASGHGVGGSDHQPFLRKEIPALHLFTGLHTDYHRPSDDVERFEADGAAEVARLVLGLVERIGAAEGGSLAFVPPSEDEAEREVAGGFRSWLGSVPEYAWEGPGVKISGTSPGSPAERAGLLPGDVLLGLGEVSFDNIYDLVHALQLYKPGDVVDVRYVRDGARESAQLTLMSRDIE